jgi:hypothetical protein
MNSDGDIRCNDHRFRPGRQSASKKTFERRLARRLIEFASVGGTCINNGCTPTKTLVGTAKNIFQAEHAAEHGLVMLHPDAETVNSVTVSPDTAYAYVKRFFHERFQVSWLRPIGFNNTYAVMMRSEDAKRLGIRTISDLSNYLNPN